MLIFYDYHGNCYCAINGVVTLVNRAVTPFPLWGWD